MFITQLATIGCLDLWIVIKTIGVIVFPRNNGAY